MLSFIIPAHNEEAYLNKTISAIHAMRDKTEQSGSTTFARLS